MSRIIWYLAIWCANLAMYIGFVSSSKFSLPKFSVIVDAGSTGTRTFVFKYENEDGGVGKVTSFPCGRVRVGLSQFYGNETAAVNMFMPMIKMAGEIIPESYHSVTPLIVKGTAGMRLLSESQQERLWEAVLNGFASSSEINFLVQKNNFGTISGRYEAYYAVIASNYLVGSIDAQLRLTNTTSVIGALDMGGGSNQLIIYMGENDEIEREPASLNEGVEIVSDKNSTTTNDKMEASQFWSHSWLKYGAEMMRSRIQDLLWSHHEDKLSNSSVEDDDDHDSAVTENNENNPQVVIENPCTLTDYVEELWMPNITGGTAELIIAPNDDAVGAVTTVNKHKRPQLVRLVGTGRPRECVRMLETVLWGAPLPNDGADEDGEELRDKNSSERKEHQDQIASPVAESEEESMVETSIDFVGNAETGPLRRAVNASMLAQQIVNELVPPSLGRPVDGVQHPSVHGQRFYAMSVYFYALDCVRYLMNASEPSSNLLQHWPTPSIAELRDVAEEFCTLPWNEVEARHAAAPHRFTFNSQLPHRCMETLYILTLWEKGFGFQQNDRAITLAYEIEGKEVEWTLGFLLAELLSR